LKIKVFLDIRPTYFCLLGKSILNPWVLPVLFCLGIVTHLVPKM